MTKMTMIICYTALLICMNVILLIAVFHQRFHACNADLRSATAASFDSHSAIPSTAETLYAMYGEGNFHDGNEHVLNYIRSMTSQQDPGSRRQLQNYTRVDYSQYGGSRFVDKLLKQRRNGFFVECGAFHGEDLSDTLFFELERNWTGILIEAHPEYHRDILRKNRHALVLRGCLSADQRPGMVKFRLKGWGSGVSAFNRNVKAADNTVPETDVQCFSLNSIMASIGIRHIDFMVLDVEGSELPVLESIDWTRLSIDVFSIEYSGYRRLQKLDKLRQFFGRRGGYKEVGKLPLSAKAHVAQDVVFMRTSTKNE